MAGRESRPVDAGKSTGDAPDFTPEEIEIADAAWDRVGDADAGIGSRKSPGRLALAQRFHDVATAHWPELCNADEPAGFAEPHERSGWRMMHDMAVSDGGAECPGMAGKTSARV